MQVNKHRRPQLQEDKSRFSQATCTSDRKPGKDTRCLQESWDGAGDQWECLKATHLGMRVQLPLESLPFHRNRVVTYWTQQAGQRARCNEIGAEARALETWGANASLTR